MLPPRELKRIKAEFIERHYPKIEQGSKEDE
jgi:hypothetical protein